MPFQARTLPVEVVLLILDCLESWKDKLSFAQAHPYIWKSSLLYRCDEELELSTQVNILQLACCARLKLADPNIPSRFLRSIIRRTYALEKFIINSSSGGRETFAEWILMHMYLHHPQARRVQIYVDEQHLLMWRDTAKKLMMKKDIHIPPPITHESLSSRCTEDSLQPSTPPPSSTIDPDLYNTPEHINQHKRWAKKMSILTGEARLRDRTEDVRSSLPLPVISLLDNGAVYKPDDLPVFQQDELLPTYIFNLSTASGCVRRYASRYLEAVIVFDDIWFLVTSVDVFLHGKPSVDDCADHTNVIMDHMPYARIRAKTQQGHEYYELSIVIGTIELLALAGFHGTTVTASANAFLGSSLRDLPQQLKQSIRAKELHIRRVPSAFASSNRHLRQYAKAGANLAWGFHSLRFLTKGFYPVNPLSYSEHASSTTRNGRIKYVLASFVLKCVAYQTVRKEDIDHMFSIAITDSVLAKCLGRSTSFVMAKDHVQARDGSDSYTFIILQHMKFLEDLAAANDINKNLQPYMTDMKSICLQIMDKGLAATLKSANRSICRKYKTTHEF